MFNGYYDIKFVLFGQLGGGHLAVQLGGAAEALVDNIHYELNEGCLLIVPAGHHYIRRPFGNEFCPLFYANIKVASSVLDDLCSSS